MKKLMIFCFSILFTVLSALSCVNFSLDAVERMEKDKATILIEEPEGMSNKDWCGIKKVDSLFSRIP